MKRIIAALMLACTAAAGAPVFDPPLTPAETNKLLNGWLPVDGKRGLETLSVTNTAGEVLQYKQPVVSRPGVVKPGAKEAFPAVAKAIERKRMQPAKPKVKMQRVDGDEVISVLDNGEVVREKLKRAVSASIDDRVRIEIALTRIHELMEGDDNAKRAHELEKLVEKLEKDKAKDKDKNPGNGAKALAAIIAAGGVTAAGALNAMRRRLAA